MRLVAVLLLGLLWASPASAACSGSGVTWTCAAGTTGAEINTAMGTATTGATLTFDAGSYTWGTTPNRISFPVTKDITLACASALACDVTVNGTMWHGSANNPSAIRITGFDFDLDTSSDKIWYPCDGGQPCGTSDILTFSSVRVDNNRFTIAAGGALVVQTDSAVTTNIVGVFDHNEFVLADQSNVLFNLPTAFEAAASLAVRYGTASNFFIEDNVFTIADVSGAGVGCTDGWGPIGVVFRFNTVQNCRALTHGVEHGYGWINFEVYGNAFTNDSGAESPSCVRSIHHQGSGQAFFFWNSFNCVSTSAAAMAVLHYRGFDNQSPGMSVESDLCDGTHGIDENRTPIEDYRGYPCKHQPGRAHSGDLHPYAAWGNYRTDTGAKLDLTISLCAPGCSGGNTLDYTSIHLKLNRDIYNAVSVNAQTSASSPFDGTTGIGHGFLTDRPTTCTATPEAADAGQGGVLYWATDQGSWNTSSSNPQGVNVSGADGVLYHCSATNTWSTYYTPYAYPHPLNGGGGGGGGGGTGTRPRLRIRLVSVPVPVVFTLVLFGGVYAIRGRPRVPR